MGKGDSPGYFQLEIAGLRKFEGPFVDDLIDLNRGRKWDPIESIRTRVDLPPEGTDIPKVLEWLVDVVR